MVANCNQVFIKSFMLHFFRFIFGFGIIPEGFNVIHIVPIIKYKKKSIDDLTNMQPISISNTLAQIFERFMSKMLIITKTHSNQFGYKNKTYCAHALFAFKETIIRYIEERNTCYAAFLYAIKAFDNLRRNALFLKLKNGKVALSLIFLLKTKVIKFSIIYLSVDIKIIVKVLLMFSIQSVKI